VATAALCERLRVRFRRPVRSVPKVAPAGLASGWRVAGWLVTIHSEADELLLDALARGVLTGSSSLTPALVLHSPERFRGELVNRASIVGAQAVSDDPIGLVLRVFSERVDRYVADHGRRWGLLDLAREPLTPREVEVGDLAVLSGWPHREVARATSISERTVESHLRRVLAKHGLRGHRAHEPRAHGFEEWR